MTSAIICLKTYPRHKSHYTLRLNKAKHMDERKSIHKRKRKANYFQIKIFTYIYTNNNKNPRKLVASVQRRVANMTICVCVRVACAARRHVWSYLPLSMSLFWRDETVRWRHRKGDAVGDKAGFCGREKAEKCAQHRRRRAKHMDLYKHMENI